MNYRQPVLRFILVLLILGMTWASHASEEIIVPRLSETPIVDGRIDEAAWMSAVESPIEPLDLVPKIHILRLPIPAPAPGITLQIELDAANQIREIHEENNVAVNLRYEAED